MLNELGGLLYSLIWKPLMTLPLNLLFRYELTSRVSNLAFRHSITPIGLTFKMKILRILEKPLQIMEWTPRMASFGEVSTYKERGINPNSFQKKSSLFRVSLLIHGGSACLLFRQTRGWVCNLPSWKRQGEYATLHTCFPVVILKR